MKKKTVRDIEVGGKRVLVRVDFNVPQNPATGEISDDSRIRASLPTIRYLIERGSRVILCSHLGRPEGRVVGKLRLKPVAQRLSQLLGQEVSALPSCIGQEVAQRVRAMKAGEVVLLENLRFHPGEEKNDPDFARELASLAEVFVNDGFGVSHRAHASTAGVTRFLPAVAGFLLEREVEALGRVLDSPARPFAAILGGAKVRDKLGVLESLVSRVDKLFIGGGMAATFLRARGLSVGRSPVEADRLDTVKRALERAQSLGVRVVLPVDVLVAPDLKAPAQVEAAPVEAIPAEGIIGDVGPLTVETFLLELQGCRTVLWNGPLGVFEVPQFATATRTIARAVADLNATTVVGGGSTAEAVEEMGLASRFSHVSTGGGASLEFLEGRPLPGIEALLDKR